MEKLISMTEKVLELQTQLKRCIEQSMPFTDLQSLKQSIQDKIFKHANLLSQKLELWMFVPCKKVNGVWVVLEEPFNDGQNDNYYSSALQEYQEAKDRVLFDGKFDVNSERQLIRFNNIMQPIECLGVIENLIKYNLQLTKTA